MYSCLLISLAAFCIQLCVADTEKIEKILGNRTIKISTTTEHNNELMDHWVNQAMSSLMAAVAQNRLPNVSAVRVSLHQKCVSKARTVKAHARCTSQLLKKGIKVKDVRQKYKDFLWLRHRARLHRVKRNIISRSSYFLPSDHDESPLSMIANHLTRSIRLLKNKKEHRSWREVVAVIKKKGEELEREKNVHQMISRGVKGKSGNDNKEEMLLQFMKKPSASIPKELTNNMTLEQKTAVENVKLIRQGIKLGMALGGQDVSNFEEKNIRLASPRFLSVVPEEEKLNEINIISPSLLSMHSEGKGIEKDTSLTKAFDDRDKDSWINLITELVGIQETVEDAEKMVDSTSSGMLVNSDGKPVRMKDDVIKETYGDDEFRKMKLLQKLHATYTKEQLDQFNTTGYAIMSSSQRKLLYGESSPYHNAEALKHGENLTHHEVTKDIHRAIHHLAKGQTGFSRRQNDIVLSPIVGGALIGVPQTASQALIISPVLLTILFLSPAIFGSVILSPWVFVPVILSPRILSPVIVAPEMFSPVILSPLLLNPIVLSPGLFNPVILSPLALCPFILSPQVMTPLILSPFALSPFILNPFVLSPLILSPFVLSPAVLSPLSVTAIVLSPYALSPSIASPPTAITVVASPSILS